MLARQNIECVFLPPRKISSLFRPAKDDLRLRTPGVYSIPFECDQVYIGKTGRSIEIRKKEHHLHIRLGHPVKSAVGELVGSNINMSLNFRKPGSCLLYPAIRKELSEKRWSWNSTLTI
jgi:hypothetical protein